jgi:hypothetical protein
MFLMPLCPLYALYAFMVQKNLYALFMSFMPLWFKKNLNVLFMPFMPLCPLYALYGSKKTLCPLYVLFMPFMVKKSTQ